MTKTATLESIDEKKKEALLRINLKWLTDITPLKYLPDFMQKNDIFIENLKRLEKAFEEHKAYTQKQLINTLEGRILKTTGKPAGRAKIKDFIAFCTDGYPLCLYKYRGEGNSFVYELNKERIAELLKKKEE